MATTLTKGQNGPLTSPDVRIEVDVAAASDLSALMVTDNGTVRTDADFVFFNQPSAPGVELQSGGAAALNLELGRVPADISQIRSVVTLEAGTFGAVPAPIARVVDGGSSSYEYRIEGLTSESIVIALEVYRRGDAWKVRAVGQGYAGGFAALVTDHGVTVDDAPAPASAPAVMPPASAPSVTPPASAPPPSSAREPAAPVAQTRAGGSPWPEASTGEVSLSKDRPINLVKGQRVRLTKDGDVALTRITMGLGWDPVATPARRGLFGGGRGNNIDLDASAMMYAGDQLADLAYYGRLTSKDGSVRHHGDNLTGEGEGDDEVIDVDLTRIPPHVTQILFIVTSYQGQTFEQIDNAFCRLIDQTNGAELARYTLAGGMPFTGIVMAKVFREPGGRSGWRLQAVGEGMQARHPGEARTQVTRFL